MALKVKLMPENKVVEMDEKKARVETIVRRLGLPLEMVVVLKNGNIATSDELVSEEDELVVMRAVSGG